MIAKITRGSRVGDIGAYLHGPGKANEHRWRDVYGQSHSGGIVIASNVGAEGHTEPARWAGELRAAQKQRPEIKKPVWQASLRNTANDRTLTDQEWADAGQSFAETMGFADHPWVMVRHGEDHVHIVASRVNDEGTVWHARQDRRAAQAACTRLERRYGLEAAPRQRQQAKKTPATVRRQHEHQAAELDEQRFRDAHHGHDRETVETARKVREGRDKTFPDSIDESLRKGRRQRGKPAASPDYQQRQRKLPSQIRQDRDHGPER